MKCRKLTPLTYLLLLMASPVFSAEPDSLLVAFNFSGFVDLRFRDVNSSVQGQGRGAESGFFLEDAAFYISKKSNKLSLLIDLPFSRQKEDTIGLANSRTFCHRSLWPSAGQKYDIDQFTL